MRPKYVLCFFLSLLIISGRTSAQIQPITPKGAVRAVVVGISDYQNLPDLRFAHRDAGAFVEYLKSPAGGKVPESNIRLLTNEKATQAQIGAALSWLITESQSGDQAIIYFSGHGDVETQISNLGYLLAYDANKTTYMAGGALPIYALQSVVSNLTTGKQVNVLLIADACRSGNLAGEATGGTKNTALALTAQVSNELKIMSCGADELSLESEEWGGGHSVFSYYLLDGLRGMADADEDRTVNLREIERYLEDSVRRATVAYRRQTPATYGSKDQVVAKVDVATLSALRQKKNPPAAPATAPDVALPIPDSTVMRLYQSFETALQRGHLLYPEEGAAYSIYEQIKDHPAMRSYRNLLRNDLAAALQDEAQKAINDYLSADPREMRRRWNLDTRRYALYPQYLEKAAELLGEGHFSYTQIKARASYFAGLNLRLQGERSAGAAVKDSLYHEAKNRQLTSLSFDSTAAYACNELGLLARRLNDPDGAIHWLNRALRFSPGWVLPWANLCGLYNDLDRYEEGEKYGLKAFSLDSMSALAVFNLGVSYDGKGDINKAIYYFKKAISLNAEYYSSYDLLGHSYYGLGQYAEAEKAWMDYLKYNNNNPDIYQCLGQVGIDMGRDVAHCEPLFLKVISLNKQYDRAYFSLGELFIKSENYPRAAQWLESYLELKPDDPEGYYLLALARHSSPQIALEALENAFKKGFKDLSKLNAEKRLATLRNKPEYKRLVKQYFP
jgi:tetratricopeptide (TPR) repeat protein